MACPECGWNETFLDTFAHSYEDEGQVIEITVKMLVCEQCFHILSIISDTESAVSIPERDPHERYYIEFDESWYIVDSFADIAEDHTEGLAEAIRLRDELNKNDPYRVLKLED